ncbi:MAG: LysE family translocator, partial [Acidimicrobiales bacterium]
MGERVISGGQLATFVVASLVIIIVPGPSVLFTLARGIAWGRAVAVLTVLGNCLGTLILSAIVAVGLGPLLAHSRALSITLQLLGGGYLIWLGIGAMRHRHEHARAMTEREGVRPRNTTIVRQGFTVGVLNPKALVFFVAVFPHFVNRS